jgi:glycerol-3-phosphate acyltransferase PlsY
MAIASVVGHNWSLFLKFSGGKGVSTTAGVLSALCLIYPDLLYALAVAILIWIIIFLVFRYVSLASLLAVTVFTLYSLIFFPWEFKLFSIVIFSLIMIRHKRNIKKLLNKSELGF